MLSTARIHVLLLPLALAGCDLFDDEPPEEPSPEARQAEFIYTTCGEVVRYYFARVDEELPAFEFSEDGPNVVTATGLGVFWNKPDDPFFLPSANPEVEGPVTLGTAKVGSRLSPNTVTCDLSAGLIRIDMVATVLLEGQDEPLLVDQVDEFQWNEQTEQFEGRVDLSTAEAGVYFQFLDSIFGFNGCNDDGAECSSIDIRIPLPLPIPPGQGCADYASESFGLEIESPEDIVGCRLAIDNLNYFTDNPSEVVVFDDGDEQILGGHLQVVNDTLLEVEYGSGERLEYRGAIACEMQFTSNSQQDWDNVVFPEEELCAPLGVVVVE